MVCERGIHFFRCNDIMAVLKREIGTLFRTCLENTFVQGSIGVPEVGETTESGAGIAPPCWIGTTTENVTLNTIMRSWQWPCSEGRSHCDAVLNEGTGIRKNLSIRIKGNKLK